jgi:uncharacterized protein with von Willebrand factor type A (vWA) domain
LLQTGGDVEEAYAWLEYFGRKYNLFDDQLDLEKFKEMLRQENLVRRGDGPGDGQGGGDTLTSKGIRAIRKESLDAIFKNLKNDAVGGDHRTPFAGRAGERLPETREWAFGDNVNDIAPTPTLQNAIRNHGIDDLRLTERDLEVYETEHSTSCATAILLDISHSMTLYGEDRFTPAKRAALALAELITTRYPKDDLEVLLFGDDCVRVPLEELHAAGNGPFYTNTKAGLRGARMLLEGKKHQNRQIFMITDGKPSVIDEPNGRKYRNPSWGLDPKIVNKTLDEAAICRRRSIPITTFMVAQDPWLVEFVEQLTITNKGRAYYADLNDLGQFVFVDYIRNRRRKGR